MPFLMIRNDITKVAADAIVNPANRNLLQGSGTSRAIYQAAGEQELTAACEAIGHCEPGRAVCTPAFGLPAKYIFHAVCPAWHGGIFWRSRTIGRCVPFCAGISRRVPLRERGFSAAVQRKLWLPQGAGFPHCGGHHHAVRHGARPDRVSGALRPALAGREPQAVRLGGGVHRRPLCSPER